MHHVKLNFGSFKSNKSKNLSIRLKILAYESDMKSCIKNRMTLWELIQFKSQKSVCTVSLRP